jgi:hypothetical protein
MTKRGLVVFVLLLVSVALWGKDDKLKKDEVIARHLQALGPAAAQRAAVLREAAGEVKAEVLQGSRAGGGTGEARLISQGNRVSFRLRFEKPEFPSEQFVFDGETVTIGQLAPGRRSAFGDFIYYQEQVVREGLLGGVLNTAWPMLNLAGREARLTYDGLKKVNGRELHQLKYRPKKAADDMDIYVYFEPETFRHAGTVYKVEIAPDMGRDQRRTHEMEATRYRLEEWFSDFREADGVTIPVKWQILYSRESAARTLGLRWTISVDRFGAAVPGGAAK